MFQLDQRALLRGCSKVHSKGAPTWLNLTNQLLHSKGLNLACELDSNAILHCWSKLDGSALLHCWPKLSKSLNLASQLHCSSKLQQAPTT